MQIRKFEIWLADLSKQIRIHPERTRPVLVVQTDLLNRIPHRSSVICPLTTNIQEKAEILRVNIKKGTANLSLNCDIMIDQVMTIENKRLIKKMGELPVGLCAKVQENLAIILDIE